MCQKERYYKKEERAYRSYGLDPYEYGLLLVKVREDEGKSHYSCLRCRQEFSYFSFLVSDFRHYCRRKDGN